MKQKLTLVLLSIVSALVVIYLVKANNHTDKNDNPTTEVYIETTEEITEPETEIETTISIYDIKMEECLCKQAEIAIIEDDMEWFVAYKAIIEEYSEWLDPPLSVYDMFTEEEIRYMLKCIETEVHGKDFNSKCNVASVILNRIDNSKGAADAVAIITAPNQFTYGRDEIEESTILALEYTVMCGRTTYEALWFRSDVKLDTWRGNVYLFTDKAGHHFYAPAKEISK